MSVLKAKSEQSPEQSPEQLKLSAALLCLLYMLQSNMACFDPVRFTGYARHQLAHILILPTACNPSEKMFGISDGQKVTGCLHAIQGAEGFISGMRVSC